MKSIETSGKTVEDAIKTGLQELRLDSTEVTIDVLDMGSPGLFGMFGRLAKVRLTVKEKRDIFDFEMPIMSLDAQVSKRQPEKKKAEPAPKREEVPAQSAQRESAPEQAQTKQDAVQRESAPERPAQNKRETAQPMQHENAPERPVQNKREQQPIQRESAPERPAQGKPMQRENAFERPAQGKREQQPMQRENAPERPAQGKRAPQPMQRENATERSAQSNRLENSAPQGRREGAFVQPQNKRNDAPNGRRAEPRRPIQGGNAEALKKAPRPIKIEAPTELELKDLPVRDIASFSDVEKKAYDFLSNLTRLMGVQVEVRIQTTEEQLMIQLIGDTLGILIGRRGETLDALQYLTSLQVNKGRDEYLRVSIDTEHYRAKREEALQKLATRMAARVRKTGHRVALEPMNPYERRVLHSALQNHPYVSTHSEGEEPYRRVIITLK